MTDRIQVDGRAYVQIGEAAALLGRDERSIRALASEGKVFLRAIGKKVYVDIDGLQQAMQEPPAAPAVAVAAPPDIISTPPEDAASAAASVQTTAPPVQDVASIATVMPKRPASPIASPAVPLLAMKTLGVALALVLVFVSARSIVGGTDVSFVRSGTPLAAASAATFPEWVFNSLFGWLSEDDEDEIVTSPPPPPSSRTLPSPSPLPPPSPAYFATTSYTTSPTPVFLQTPPPAPPAPPTQTLVTNPVERIIERVVTEEVNSYISPQVLAALLASRELQIREDLLYLIGESVGRSVENIGTSGLELSDLTDANIPNDITASNYLPLSGGTLTGALTVTTSGTSTFSGGVNFAALNITGSATSTFAQGIDLAGGCFAIDGTCISGSGSSASSTLLTDSNTWTGNNMFLASTTIGGGTLTTGLTISGGATTTGTAYFAGNVGIGTTSPWRKLSITDTVATAQLAIAYDATRATELQTDSTGDLIIDPSGDDVLLSDDNFLVCTSSCGTSPSGTGSILAENMIGIGTTTPAYKLTIETQDDSSNFLQVASTTAQSLLVVNASGNVGVATSSPFAKFTVGANGAITTVEHGLTDGATVAINWLDGNQQKVTLGGNREITFTSFVAGQILRLVVCQDGTGSRTLTWPAVVLWQGGSAPTLTTTADQCDVVSFVATNATSSLVVFGAATAGF